MTKFKFFKGLIQKTGLMKKYISRFPKTKIKPFTLSDLKSVPDSWIVGGANFIGIGTVKAGTTWWYSLLLEHPQIVNNRLNLKELRYFVHFDYKGLNAKSISIYNQAFAAPQGSICGEWSPIYLHHPFCIDYIHAAAPKAKILVIIRNPIDRIVSFLNEAAYGISNFNFNRKQKYVQNYFNIYPSAILSGFYAKDFKRLLHYFDREQILVLQYEKCKKDPECEIAQTYRFLGVDDQFQPKDLKNVVNRKEYIFPNLTSDERHRLAEYYREDVSDTIRLFPNIDLSLWKDFKN